MSAGTLMSLEEYLGRSFHPDCHFVDGVVLERSVGQRRHSYAQGEIASWFNQRKAAYGLQALPELRMQVRKGRVRIPDVVLAEIPIPEEGVFTAPPYLCIEIMSPEDTMSSMQNVIDDYLLFGVAQIWVIDPWKHRGWRVTAEGWAAVSDGVMRTSDGRVAMALSEVLLA